MRKSHSLYRCAGVCLLAVVTVLFSLQITTEQVYSQDPAPSSRLINLDSFNQLKQKFNKASGKVRLITLLSPT